MVKKYETTLNLFETVYCSHILKHRKPERKCYEEVLYKMNLTAKDVIFLDDNIDNISGAKSIGIKSILVENQEQMKSDLFKILNH